MHDVYAMQDRQVPPPLHTMLVPLDDAQLLCLNGPVASPGTHVSRKKFATSSCTNTQKQMLCESTNECRPAQHGKQGEEQPHIMADSTVTSPAHRTQHIPPSALKDNGIH